MNTTSTTLTARKPNTFDRTSVTLLMVGVVAILFAVLLSVLTFAAASATPTQPVESALTSASLTSASMLVTGGTTFGGINN